MHNLVVRPRALTDLAKIWAYIAEDSPERADAFADLLWLAAIVLGISVLASLLGIWKAMRVEPNKVLS